jgi:threonine aldolase
MTWKRGVDILSFGGTKNGCWCAEALVLFDPAKAGEMGFMHKRAAQLFSKTRFIALQFSAYFEDGLWLETAAHANAMAARLARHIQASKKVRLAWQPDANEVFAVMAGKTMQSLHQEGAVFSRGARRTGFGHEIGQDETLPFRNQFATTETEVDRFGALIV